MALHLIIMIIVLKYPVLILYSRPKQLPYDLSLLEKAVLLRLDGSGGKVRGRELWQRHGAVIMVVRRPG